MPLAILNPTTREWIDIVTGAATAVGTVGAVIVALYLSRRERRPRLNVEAAITLHPAWGDLIGDAPRGVTARATNIGLVPISTSGFGWRIGFIRHSFMHQIPPIGVSAAAKLDYGEQKIIVFPFNGFFENWEPIRTAVSQRRFPRLALRSVRPFFSTTVGKHFCGNLTPWLRDEIRKDFDSHAKK
jgi:hypothetical protein